MDFLVYVFYIGAVIIFVVLVVTLLVAIDKSFARGFLNSRRDNKRWNNGRCPRCDMDWDINMSDGWIECPRCKDFTRFEYRTVLQDLCNERACELTGLAYDKRQLDKKLLDE